jgi:hypothetical protein
MIVRAVVIWVLLVVLAIANGAVRDVLVSPHLGEQVGHVISTGILCAVILVVAWASVRWVGPVGIGACLRIGLLWSVLTLGFEFVAGHYLFGTPWATLLADYNLAKGRVWPLVVVTTTVAPLLAARGRGL